MKAEILMGVSFPSRLFALTGFTLGRMGVPLFLFLTGYLLLDRVYDEGKCYHFWRKNWAGMLITTEVWIILYDVFLRVFHFQHWSTAGLLKNMFFLDQVHMGHMWYMPMIAGLYLCIPFAARALRGISPRMLVFPMTVLGFYAFGVPFWNQAFGKNPGQGFVLDLGFSGGVYGLYLLSGYALKKGLLVKLSSWQAWAGCLSFFLLTLFSELYAYGMGRTYNVWYNCGFLLLACLFLFEGMSRISFAPLEGALAWISRNSFGIYLVHFPFLMLLVKLVGRLPVMMPVKVALLYGTVLAVSVVVCGVIDHFPKISRVLLYNR